MGFRDLVLGRRGLTVAVLASLVAAGLSAPPPVAAEPDREWVYEPREGFGEPIDMVEAVPLGSGDPVEQGPTLTSVAGDSWQDLDLAGAGRVVPGGEWTPVPGVPVEVRLARDPVTDVVTGEESVDPGAVDGAMLAREVVVSTSMQSGFGPAALRIDIDPVNVASAAGEPGSGEEDPAPSSSETPSETPSASLSGEPAAPEASGSADAEQGDAATDDQAAAGSGTMLPALEVRLVLDQARGAVGGGDWVDSVVVQQVVETPECPTTGSGAELGSECVQWVPVATTPKPNGSAVFSPIDPVTAEAAAAVLEADAGGDAAASTGETPAESAEAESDDATAGPDAGSFEGDAGLDGEDPAAAGADESASGSGFDSGSLSDGVTLLATGDTTQYKATPVSLSSSWQVGAGTGEFSYTVPFEVPDPLKAGAVPAVSLGYSSGSVDAMTYNANGQGSAAGLGWDFTVPFISRSYASCSEDGEPASGELCWRTRFKTIGEGEDQRQESQVVDELRLTMNGVSSTMIALDGTPNRFRLENDPGWRIERLGGIGAGNERFTVETPDGSTYYFGSRDPGADGTSAQSDPTPSVWRVPVRGNDAGEPAHVESDQVRQQGWRWNLDRVVDAHKNLISYNYDTETNAYTRGTGSNANVSYTSAGLLASIEYGYRDVEIQGSPDKPVARVVFDTATRCSSSTATNCSVNDANAQYFPDVPMNLRCTVGTQCAQRGPSFFGTRKYAAVRTKVRASGTADWSTSLVDRWELGHAFPDGQAGEVADRHLFLDSIRRYGRGDDSEIAAPPMTFSWGGTLLPNRVIDQGGFRPLLKPRLSEIFNESGGRLRVSYGHQNKCGADWDPQTDRDDATKDCFAQWFDPTPNNGDDSDAKFHWFHKYLVIRVGASDASLGYSATPAPEDDTPGVTASTDSDACPASSSCSVLGEWQVTDYDYVGDPAWRFTDDRNRIDRNQDEGVKQVGDRESWDDWRGYETVRMTQLESRRRQLTGAELSTTKITRFRGMAGSLRNEQGDRWGDRLVDVTEATATPETRKDWRWLAGRVTEQTVIEPLTSPKNPGVTATQDQPISRTYTQFDWIVSGQGRIIDDRSSRHVYARVTRSHAITKSTDVADVKRVVTTTVNDGQGSAVLLGAVEKVVDVADGAVEVCQVTTWRGSAQPYLRAPSSTKTLQGDCDAGATRAETRMFYDGDSDSSPASLTRGDLTLQRTRLTGTAGDFADDSYTYDAYGRTTQHTGPEGLITRTTITPAGTGGAAPVATVVTQQGTLDANGALKVGTRTFETTTTYSERRGLPVRERGLNSTTMVDDTRLDYDGLGRLKTVRLPGNVASTDPPSMAFSYQFADLDGEGINPRPSPYRVTSEAWRGDRLDRMVEFSDGWGRSIETHTPSYWHDPNQPQPLTARVVSVTGYDSLGRPAWSMPSVVERTPISATGTTVVNPRGTTVTSGPDKANVLNYTRTLYDAASRTRQVIRSDSARQNAELRNAVTTWDHDGTTATTNPPRGGPRKDVADARGQTTQTIQYKNTAGDPAQVLKANYAYTATGQLASITSDVAANRLAEQWSYTYDIGGRRTIADDPDTGVTTTTFDRNGRPLSTTDAAGRVTTTTYDALGRPWQVRDGSSGASNRLMLTHTYDAATRGIGLPHTSVRHNYPDPQNLLQPLSITEQVSSYDEMGRPTTATTTYPQKLRVVNAIPSATETVTMARAYNKAGWPTSQTTTFAADVPTTTLNYAYTPAGTIDTITIPAAQGGFRPLEKVYYQADNRPHFKRSSAAAPSLQGMDRYYAPSPTSGRIDTIAFFGMHSDGTKNVTRDMRYTRDTVGNITQVMGWHNGTGQQTSAWCYTYDDLDRLTSSRTSPLDAATECASSGWGDAYITGAQYRMDYSYDTAYNRLTGVTTSSPTQAQATQTYSYSSQADQPAHAPTAFPASSFGTSQHVATYDAAGNVTTAGPASGTKDTYTYDAFGKYASVTRADGSREDYVYGPDGTRVGLLTTTGSGAAATVTATLDIASAQYKTGQTALLAVNSPDGELLGYRHQYGWTSAWTDLQGSVRYLTDQGFAKRDYYPHGALADTMTGVWSRGYLGMQHDKPGQVQLGHRKYPAQHRTFLNPDPILVPFEPVNLNPYAYAQHNPISLTDPSGLNVDHDHITPGTSGTIGVDENMDCDTVGDCNNSDLDGDGVTTATAVYGEQAVEDYYYNPNRDFGGPRDWAAGVIHGTAISIDFVGNCGSLGTAVFNCGDYLAGGGARAGEDLADDFSGRIGANRRSFTYMAGDAFGVPLPSGAVAGGVRLLGRAGAANRATRNNCLTNSFTGNTLVLMADGTKKPIKDVKLGDLVMATDPETGETGPRKVVDLIRHSGPHRMVAVRLADGTTIDATDRHPFWVESREAWVDAIDLRSGDIVVTAEGDQLTVEGVGVGEQDLIAHNLSVAGLHTYHVGEEEVLVHNCRRPTAATRRAADEAATDADGVLRCQACGTVLITRSGSPNSREFDHIFPFSRGGGREIDNIWDLCRTCNRQKGANTLDEWGWPW